MAMRFTSWFNGLSEEDMKEIVKQNVTVPQEDSDHDRYFLAQWGDDVSLDDVI